MYLDLGLLKPQGPSFPSEEGGVVGMGVDVDAPRPPRLRKHLARDVEDAFRSEIQVLAEDPLRHEPCERQVPAQLALEPLVLRRVQTDPRLREGRCPFLAPFLRGSRADRVGFRLGLRDDLRSAYLRGLDDPPRFVLRGGHRRWESSPDRTCHARQRYDRRRVRVDRSLHEPSSHQRHLNPPRSSASATRVISSASTFARVALSGWAKAETSFVAPTADAVSASASPRSPRK